MSRPTWGGSHSIIMRFHSSLAASALLILAASSAAATVGAPSSASPHAGAPRDLEIPGHGALTARTADIEARNPAVLVFGGLAAFVLAFSGVMAAIREFQSPMTKLLREAVIQNGTLNYVLVHPEHTVRFAGKNGTDWAQSLVEIKPTADLPSVLYHFYAFKEGEITVKGNITDNDFIEDASIRSIDRLEDGTHYVFCAPNPIPMQRYRYSRCKHPLEL